jgi:hypothetical protein
MTAPASPRSQTFALLMLTAVLAGLVALYGRVVNRDIDISPLAAPAAAGSAGGGGDIKIATPLDQRPIASLTETIRRPMFSPTRRPPEPKIVAAPPPVVPPVAAKTPPPVMQPPAPAGVRVLGIVRDGDTALRALLRGSGEAHGTWVNEGGQFKSWRVARITPASVVLEAGGVRHELKIFAADPGADGTASAPKNR